MSVAANLWASVRGYVVLALLCGGIYSLVVWGVAQGFFSATANGSLIVQHGQVIGSRWIEQGWSGPEWFHGRPSATTPTPYNAANSGATNLGPTNPALIKEVEDNLSQYTHEGIAAADVPPDLVESSGSGLDPFISPASALVQVPIVAQARHLPPAQLRALVARYTQKAWLGMYGAPGVNVLQLNLALGRLVSGG